jgi:DMSO/TMAO reductase YedYZ heme-binding membrane subunit
MRAAAPAVARASILAMPNEVDASKLPPARLWQPVTIKWFVVVFGFSLSYGILRYHVLGDVAWSDFPLFILNKTIALAAVIFVACSYLVGRVFQWHNHDPAIRLVVVKFCGLGGFFLAGMHAFFSVCLLRPAYFAKYFEDGGRLNMIGEIGMATGVVALFLLLSPAITTLPMMPKAIGGARWKRSQRVGYLGLLLVVAHLVDLGLKGWLNIGNWGMLPPISLVAVVAALIPLVVKRREMAVKSG